MNKIKLVLTDTSFWYNFIFYNNNLATLFLNMDGNNSIHIFIKEAFVEFVEYGTNYCIISQRIIFHKHKRKYSTMIYECDMKSAILNMNNPDITIQLLSKFIVCTKGDYIIEPNNYKCIR